MHVVLRNCFFISGAVVLSMIALSGCGLEASIFSLDKPLPGPEKAQRVEPDFVASEVVTTGSGAVVRGSFGEISEKKTLSNNVVIEGAFYE